MKLQIRNIIVFLVIGCSLVQHAFCAKALTQAQISSKKSIALSKKTEPEGLLAQADVAKVQLGPVEAAIAGCIATGLGDFIMHPVDTIKTVQQAASTALSVGAACRKILGGPGGWLGFYQGVGPYVLADGLAGAVKFATYEVSKKWVQRRIPEEWVPYSHFVCAAGAMLASSFVLVPGELLKQQLQAGVASSLPGAVAAIWQAEGARGFLTGWGATLVRDIPYTMLELGLYDNFKAALVAVRGGGGKATQRDELYSAALTGAIAGFCTTPLDLVKTKLMTAEIGAAAPGLLEAARSIVAADGAAGLFKGAAARVAWLAPFTIIYLPLYDATKRTLVAMKQSKADSGLDRDL